MAADDLFGAAAEEERRQGTISTIPLTSYVYATHDPGLREHCGIHQLDVRVRHTRTMTAGGSIGPLGRATDLRVQLVSHRDARRSYVVLDVETGCVHPRAERFLAPFGEGTQRTYAYHLLDHLRWLASTGYAEENVTIEDLKRYMALGGAEHAGPLGIPWRQRPLGLATQGVRANCVKGYYLDLTTREDVNVPLRAALSERRLANGRDRDRSVLGHLTISVAANPLSREARRGGTRAWESEPSWRDDWTAPGPTSRVSTRRRVTELFPDGPGRTRP
ncbi:MAG TPA: hypothetical protein VGR26_02725 [Acidimicrobiales bacterium]|nr:hypothetical protein [Acidimicrobiales bacterium]